jgi:cobalt-precorrin-5B (C1)-methyltransferase
MSRKPKGPLRKGWTTGACAMAAASAAFRALVTGRFPDPVTVRLPKGETPSFALTRKELANGHATAGVVKDAGDDPDVTHGAEIVATVAKGPPGSGVTFHAGEGVGIVTRPGLALAVGEPAINPAPRKMMADAIAALARELGAAGDVAITISIPGGEALAKKTMNGRLGIVGGLSVLGTTGIVIPYSCASWIHSIHRGIDVARAAGLTHVAAATGKTSEAAVQTLYDLPEVALIDMGDFCGGLLKYLAKKPIAKLTLAGGFGKVSKLAQGHLDLHSSDSRVDMKELAELLGALGADNALVAKARAANTANEVLEIAAAASLKLGDMVARRAREVALATVGGGTEIEVAIFDRQGQIVGRAGG